MAVYALGGSSRPFAPVVGTGPDLRINGVSGSNRGHRIRNLGFAFWLGSSALAGFASRGFTRAGDAATGELPRRARMARVLSGALATSFASGLNRLWRTLGSPGDARAIRDSSAAGFGTSSLS